MPAQFCISSIALAPPLVQRPYAPHIVHTHFLRHCLGQCFLKCGARPTSGAWRYCRWGAWNQNFIYLFLVIPFCFADQAHR